MTSDPRLANALAILGAAVLAIGLAWWWLVFREVVANDYISYRQAATCIGGSSDLCTLAQALCKSSHWLGIKTYSSSVFWAGLATISVSLILRSARRSA
jgi:hypothetical protein